MGGEDASHEPQSHWSFRPIQVSVVPAARDTAWVRNPIDAFVLRSFEDEGLEPALPANRLALLRRPFRPAGPSPCSRDGRASSWPTTAPDAYERLVDRLLASPQYGERWGRHWLDVVRYADTGGFEHDFVFTPAPGGIRDYVIRSFNADKPFDRFIQEQVAGDELWPDDPERSLATALYSVGPCPGRVGDGRGDSSNTTG